MAREPIYNLQQVCPECYSTVQLLGKIEHQMWRCTNPMCKYSKQKDGVVAGRHLIDKKRIEVIVHD